jgi:hypothetical protein
MNLKKISITLALLLLCTLIACGEAPDATKPTTEAKPSYTEITPFDLQGILKVENASPYSGVYIETEEKDRVEGVYALRFTNISEKTIMLAELHFTDGTNDLYFNIEMLPVGDSVIVVELNKTPMISETPELVQAAVNYLEEGMENWDCVKISGEEHCVLNITNVTEETLPGVWVFYRRTTPDGEQLGGPCHSCMVVDLEPGLTDNPDALHWSPGHCVVVNVILIDPQE